MIKKIIMLVPLFCLMLCGCGTKTENVSSSVVVSTESVDTNVYRGVSWSYNYNDGSLVIYWTNKDQTKELNKTYESGKYQVVYRRFESWNDYENYFYDYGKTCLLILTIKDAVIY